MRRRRDPGVALAVIAGVTWCYGWLAGNVLMERSAALLGVVASGLLAMAAIQYAQMLRYDATRSPRKLGFRAAAGIGLGATIIAFDVHEFLLGRALNLCRYCAHQTFARATFPSAFWASHAFFFGGGLLFVIRGLQAARNWLRPNAG